MVKGEPEVLKGHTKGRRSYHQRVCTPKCLIRGSSQVGEKPSDVQSPKLLLSGTPADSMMSAEQPLPFVYVVVVHLPPNKTAL